MTSQAILRASPLPAAVRITALTLLAQFAISFQLWVPSVRAFPLVSAFESLPLHFGVTVDAILLVVACASLLYLLLRPTSAISLVLVLIASLLFVLEDIPRLQPWLYLDAIFFLSILVYRADQDRTLRILTLLMALTYFWSGMQKFNYAFTVEIFPWLADTIGMKAFFHEHRTLIYVVPAIEAFVGVGLLVARLRKVAIALGVALHLFLLWALGPSGVNWNLVIWPWNVQMILLLLLQLRSPQVRLTECVRSHDWLAIAVVLIAGLLPVLNYLGHFDNHLSGSLYASNNPEAIFCYDSADRERLPTSARPFQFTNDSMHIEFITLDQWFIAETEAPFYPEERYFRRIGQSLTARLMKPELSYVLMTRKARFTSEQTLQRLETSP